MRWDEFINQGEPDEESVYDGWVTDWELVNGSVNYKNFYECYRCIVNGISIGMHTKCDEFELDEMFNIELKCAFPNIVLVDNFTKRDDELKFFCEVCKHSFIKTGNSILETGCPYCKESKYKGENLLSKILDNRKIDYIKQISYGCVNPKTGHELYYDFIINNGGNLIFVEIQGRQHYEPVDFFGGEEGYEYRVYKDNVKRKYAEENGIFIALDYKEHNLDLLEERINEQLIPLINKEC